MQNKLRLSFYKSNSLFYKLNSFSKINLSLTIFYQIYFFANFIPFPKWIYLHCLFLTTVHKFGPVFPVSGHYSGLWSFFWLLFSFHCRMFFQRTPSCFVFSSHLPYVFNLSWDILSWKVFTPVFVFHFNRL